MPNAVGEDLSEELGLKKAPKMLPVQVGEDLSAELGLKSSAPTSGPGSSIPIVRGGEPEKIGEGVTAPRLKKGLTVDQLVEGFGYRPEELKKSKYWNPEAVKDIITDPDSLAGSGFVAPLIGLKRGFVDDPLEQFKQTKAKVDYVVGTGAEKVTGPDMQYVNFLRRLKEADYQQNIRHGKMEGPGSEWDVARGFGNVLATVPLGGAAEGAGVMEGMAQAGRAGAVASMGLNTVEEAPGTEGDVAGWLKAKGLQGVVGGVAAAGLQGVGAALSRGVAQWARNPPEMRNPERLAMQEATTTARAMERRLVDEAVAAPYENLAAIEAAAAEGDARAQWLLDDLALPGNEELATMTRNSGRVELHNRKLRDRANYNRVEQGQGGVGVPLRDFMSAMRGGLQTVRRSLYPDQDSSGMRVEGLLQSILARVLRRRSDPTYGLARDLRSRLGDKIRRLNSGNDALSGTPAARILQRAREALERDMDRAVRRQGVPQLSRDLDAANHYHQTQVVPYERGEIARAFSELPADRIYDAFSSAGSAGEMQLLFDTVGTKGQAALRALHVQRALEAAVDPVTGYINPSALAERLYARRGPGRVLFSSARDRAVLDGFTNTVREMAITARRVAEAEGHGEMLRALTPHVLQRALAIGATMFRAQPVRDLLIRAANFRAGSPRANAILNEIERAVQKTAAVKAGEATR